MGWALREEQFFEIFLAVNHLPKGGSIHLENPSNSGTTRKEAEEQISMQDVRWVSYQNICPEVPASDTTSQLAGAPMWVHAPAPSLSQGSPGAWAQGEAPCAQSPQGNLGLHTSPAVRPLFWGQKEENKRDCYWRFRRTSNSTLTVRHFKWWHSHVFSILIDFSEGMSYTSTK